MIYMETCLPQPIAREALPFRDNNVVSPTYQLSTLLPHMPLPISRPSLPSTQHEVGCQIDQPAVHQHCHKIFLPGVLRFAQLCIEVS